MDYIRLPELLAPAGSPEALDAAIEAGADAVYFGAGSFNARMRARNFSDGELAEAFGKCRAYGVKSYVTVNTRLRDSELDDAVSLAELLYLDGADALIVADPGAARRIKERIPSFELHASTQMSGHSSYDAAALRDMGFSRMVCPREMSKDEIKVLCERSPVEIEMFVHGAHCVSFSGQCLMSFALGGRSGNRGECAQPCRLPYKMSGVDDDHPLSLKDMSLASRIPEIIELGVASLKIEGRQKSADYVYGVTSIYRRLLDERRAATPREERELSELFSRGGFTDGYFESSYRKMLGMRDEESRATSVFGGLTRKIPVDARLVVKTGERTFFELSGGGRTERAVGSAAPRREGGEAMSESAAREKAAKLGATPFVLRSFSAEIDPDAYFSLSELNALRREAASALAAPVTRSEGDFAKVDAPRLQPQPSKGRKLLTAEFPSYSVIPDAAFEYFDKIYVPLSDACHADGKKVFTYLDPLTYDAASDEIRKALSRLTGEVMVHGFGQAKIARDAGLSPAASFRFNVTNRFAASEVLKLASSVTISPEAPSALCRDIPGETSVIVYGRLPLMLTERCAISDGGAKCPFGGAGGRVYPPVKKKRGGAAGKTCDGALCRAALEDRRGAKFPVFGLSDCSNVIYNSVPVYMADRSGFFASTPSSAFHFIFTVESRAECEGIIEAYRTGATPGGAVRRIK